MVAARQPAVLIAHRRAPIRRLIRANLEADGLAVLIGSTADMCLTLLRSHTVGALVLDAGLIQGDDQSCMALFQHLQTVPIPTLLLSWESGDRLLARALRHALFLSRPDDIDQIRGSVNELLAAAAPV